MGHYNAVQRVLYAGVIAVILQVTTGLAIWKPVQSAWLGGFFGGYPIAPGIHLAIMFGIVAFVLVHVALVVIHPAHAEVDARHRARRDRGKPMSSQRNKPAVRMAEIKPELERLHRRGLASCGGVLALRRARRCLTGCELSTHSGVDAALEAILHFDDRVQAALFSRQRLAQTYPASAITRPFRFNAYYAEWQVRPGTG